METRVVLNFVFVVSIGVLLLTSGLAFYMHRVALGSWAFI